jgi:hypothetical protein
VHFRAHIRMEVADVLDREHSLRLATRTTTTGCVLLSFSQAAGLVKKSSFCYAILGARFCRGDKPRATTNWKHE